MRERFGLSCALATPFGADDRLDVAALTEHARWCLGAGCSSVTLFGTTGEGASVGDAERREAVSALRAAGIAGSCLVGTVASCSIEGATAQARTFLDAGCRALLVTPPFYFKHVDDEALFAWHQALFANLGETARVILYNIPSVTQVTISVELVGRLRRAFPDVVAGVKDSSGDWANTQALLATHRDIAILVGDERSLAAGVRSGAEGAISGMANVMPETLLPLALDGREDERVGRLVDIVLAHPVVPAVKALAAERSGSVAWRRVRPPLAEVPEAASRELVSAYRSAFPVRAA